VSETEADLDRVPYQEDGDPQGGWSVRGERWGAMGDKKLEENEDPIAKDGELVYNP